MKLIRKFLFCALIAMLALPLGADAKEEKKSNEVPCPECQASVKIPKPKKKRKMKNKSSKKRKEKKEKKVPMLKCRKCNHEFALPKQGKKAPSKKAAPPKAATENGE